MGRSVHDPSGGWYPWENSAESERVERQEQFIPMSDALVAYRADWDVSARFRVIRGFHPLKGIDLGLKCSVSNRTAIDELVRVAL